MIRRIFYHVSACSDSVSVTYAVISTGALGIIFPLTDKPWERLGPGVVVFHSVHHASGKEKTITIIVCNMETIIKPQAVLGAKRTANWTARGEQRSQPS